MNTPKSNKEIPAPMDKINKYRERCRAKIESIIDGILMELLQGIDPNDQRNFIFRGHKEYGHPVKSSLRRVFDSSSCPATCNDLAVFNITDVESILPIHVAMYSGEAPGDLMETLSHIQHYGGATNRIDFTVSPEVALFFACDKYNNYKDDKDCEDCKNGKDCKRHKQHDGEIFLLPRDGEEYQIIEPHAKFRRVFAQGSVFVKSSKGYVKCSRSVKIPHRYKPDIFRYLWDYRGISPHTIYGDMQGYLAQAAAGMHDEFIEFRSAIAYGAGVEKFRKLGDDAKMNAAILKSLQCYDAAIKKDPHHAQAYHNRGSMKMFRRDYRGALKDFNKGGKIGSRNSVNVAYFNRGRLFARMDKHAKAIQAFELAVKLSKNGSRDKRDICMEIIKCCGMFGNNCQIQGDWEHAISYYQQIKHLGQYVPVAAKSILEVDKRIAECESKLRTQG